MRVESWLMRVESWLIRYDATTHRDFDTIRAG